MVINRTFFLSLGWLSKSNVGVCRFVVLMHDFRHKVEVINRTFCLFPLVQQRSEDSLPFEVSKHGFQHEIEGW